MFVMAVVMTCMAYRSGQVSDIAGSRGTVFPSPNQWLPPGELSLVISLLLMSLTVISFIALNKVFNFMRAPSALAASLYIVMLASQPVVAGQFYGGTLMCMVLLGVTAALFSSYGDRTATRRVFLIFMLLSLASLIQYAFMFYVPVAIIGLAQMRILNFRSVMAMIIGMICPVWILYGFGLMDFSDIGWPNFTSTLSQLGLPGMITVFSAVGVTIILGFGAMCFNLMKILSYNARYRSYNGFLTLLMLATMLFCIVDYVNLSVYFPILSLSCAAQVAHYFSIRQVRGSQWVILGIFVLYMVIYSACYYLSDL